MARTGLSQDPTQTAPLGANPRKLTEPALCVISINIEGFSKEKAQILSELCRTTNCDILCIQETHRSQDQTRPEIPGLTLVAEIPHPKYGSAVYVKPNTAIVSASVCFIDSIEVVTIDTGHCTITSVYKPPNQPFKLSLTDNFKDRESKIVVGDFNSHNIAWGYQDTNPDGFAVEHWAEVENLTLLHDAKLPKSFNSCRWKRSYNPDLIFTSDNISRLCVKTVCLPIPRTQHRPIACQVYGALKPTAVPFRRRFNFSKANWRSFSQDLDDELSEIEPIPENYDQFVKAVWSISRRNIPRGCRSLYVPGLNKDSSRLLEVYKSLYANDAFSEETVTAGEELLSTVSENHKQQWLKTVESIDMTKNSKKAWATLRKLTGDPLEPSNPGKVTANQVAHQLLLNGKAPSKLPKLPKSIKNLTPSSEISKPFTLLDLIPAIKALKNGKAAGLDDITVEQLKNLGPVGVSWLLTFFNACLESSKIPKIWRKAQITALLKPGKLADNPKNYRPISLLCHTFKLFERLLLNRLQTVIDPKLIPEQAGFRPGKSCSGQILRLSQYIEDGFEARKITAAVFVDLSAAYDTVNIKRLLAKLSNMIDDQGFIRILGEMLRNRRYQVLLNTEKSRWRSQKNGLPQGSVLAPILFNIYTNDQPTAEHCERFLYADDLALATQTDNFEDAEKTLEAGLETLGKYYENNALRPNPTKTQTCAFHLRNNSAWRTLNISWQGVNIEHCTNPIYLGVTFDRALTFKIHCLNTKKKVGTRNNLLKRLTSTTWGASPQVLRTTGLALCFSAGEYACPVWHRSTHAKEVDVALNETCRTITGCLKPTPVRALYPTAGIAPPHIRREVASAVEKLKQETDTRHPLYSAQLPTQRLKSRHSFLKSTVALSGNPADVRRKLWQDTFPPLSDYLVPSEHLPAGFNLPWSTWKSLNRLRTQVGRCNSNLAKWGYRDITAAGCECGAESQSMLHLLSCPLCPKICSQSDLCAASDEAVEVAKFWATKI